MSSNEPLVELEADVGDRESEQLGPQGWDVLLPFGWPDLDGTSLCQPTGVGVVVGSVAVGPGSD